MPDSPRALIEPASEASRAQISLAWLVRLRWGALAGQLAAIAVAHAAHTEVEVARLLMPALTLVITNLALVPAGRRWPGSARLLCGSALVLDTFLLTDLLRSSGGAANPFSVLYLVHITLSAAVLGARWTWLLALLSLGAYGWLFTGRMAPAHAEHGPDPELNMHLQGMWVAFAVAALLIAAFVTRLAGALEQRDAAIALIRERAARSERVAAVTTLAAGAAHELGTPLGTIAVASHELERAVRALPDAHRQRLLEDAGLIRLEVERCRGILTRLAADAGQHMGEAPREVRLGALLEAARGNLPALHRPRVRLTLPSGDASVSLPQAALLQVIDNLLRNALEAGPGPVDVLLARSQTGLRLEIRDHAGGMSSDVLARAGEPFFSTKPPGSGLGLGIFIARSLCEQMGGRLSLDSKPGSGTCALVELDAAGAPRAA